MALTIPTTDLQLAASTALIAPLQEWDFLVSELSKSVHPADFWQQKEPEKGVSIAEVRAMQRFALHSPVGEYKVAVLRGGDVFRPETANALLKIVEEPPAYLYVVILSETGNFIPTLRSRLRQLQFKNDSATIDSEWQKALKTQNLAEPVERKKAQQLLYAHALTHSTIKPKPIIDSFL